ncbi:MAG TPA: metal-sensitive transcriptional regulator [Alloiococcus sp.]|nr:metal-sensitive transcriptional regulator [Alloiococcus sp.]
MEYDKKLKNRVKRVEGQLRGVLKMMEENKECRDVATQMSAARNALDRTLALIVSQNLEECIRNEKLDDESSEQLIEEAVSLLIKSH